MVATLQFLSGGRYILGIGAGGREDEYLAYGYDFPAANARVEQLDEALQIMKALWTQERASFVGKHYQVREAWCEPKPEVPPTIMVGAFKPKMLRLAARHVDWWNVSSTGIADYRQLVEECERACAEVGRAGATLRRTWCGGCACAPAKQDVAKILAERPLLQPGEDFIGTPEQLLAQMQPFVDLGVDYFMLDCQGFPDLTTATMLVSEVLPALNRA
jgi:alkanesulfonate monooxygenase SsuD/methylene tetrahydromethanopterin reductase-like flavin-dependent oxidoreductase (luciferase family)